MEVRVLSPAFPAPRPRGASDETSSRRAETVDLYWMTTRVRRGVTTIEIVSIAAACAFTAHTILPDGGSVAHFFDYRLYYAIVVAAAGLTIARAVALAAASRRLDRPLDRRHVVRDSGVPLALPLRERRQRSLSVDRGCVLPRVLSGELRRPASPAACPPAVADARRLGRRDHGGVRGRGDRLRGPDRRRRRHDRGLGVGRRHEPRLPARRRDPPLTRRRRLRADALAPRAARGRTWAPRSRSARSPTARTSTRPRRGPTRRAGSWTPRGRPACS